MYLILSRINQFERELLGYTATLSEARAAVDKRIADCGSYADRLHHEAFTIAKIVEHKGGSVVPFVEDNGLEAVVK